MKVRCIKLESNVTNFTSDKIYEAVKCPNGNLYEVKDDLGLTRFINPDGSKCPHLVYWNGLKGTLSHQHSAGHWERIEECI